MELFLNYIIVLAVSINIILLLMTTMIRINGGRPQIKRLFVFGLFGWFVLAFWGGVAIYAWVHTPWLHR